MFASTGQGILGSNMYAYCLNNPVNYIDNAGYFAGAILGFTIGGVGGAIGGAISAAIKGENIINGAMSGAYGGALGGLVAGAIVDFFVVPGSSFITAIAIGALAGASGGVVSSIATQRSNYRLNTGSMDGFQLDVDSIKYSALSGMLFSGVGSGFGHGVAQVCSGNQAIGALAGSLFTVGNATTDIVVSSYVAVSSRTSNAPIGSVSRGGVGNVPVMLVH